MVYEQKHNPSNSNILKLLIKTNIEKYIMASKQLSVLGALIFIVALVGMALVLSGKVPAVIFSVASMGVLILWMFTTYRTPIDTQKVIVPYLLTIIFFIIHVYEEYLTDFGVVITAIFGFHMYEKNFLTVTAFVAPILWITGAILIIKKTYIGFYFLSFFFFAMMFAELLHFIFPFLGDGTFHYVSDMYPAAIPLIPAGYSFI